MKLIRKIFLWIKYRNVKFKREDKSSQFKSFSSSFLYPHNISISENVSIGPKCHLDGAGGIEIGAGTIIAPEVTLLSRTHNFDAPTALPFDEVMLVAPINIGKYVWIGTKVIILPGVNIGDGAIIGAGAVVSKNIDKGAIAIGNPAKTIKFRNLEKFEELAKSSDNFVYKKYGHRKKFLPKQ